MIVGTPKNLLTLINNHQSNFIPTGDLTIIVRKLTMKIIEEAIEDYVNSKEGAYWLKLYHFASKIGLDVFDKLQKSQDECDEEFDKKLRNL